MKRLLLVVALSATFTTAQTPKKPETPVLTTEQQALLKEALTQWQQAEIAARPFKDREDAAKARFYMLAFNFMAELGLKPSEHDVKTDDKGAFSFPKTEKENAVKVDPKPAPVKSSSSN